MTTTTLTVRLSDPLSSFVEECVSEHGNYESVSEYLRDLIRKDKERVEQERFERLKAELRLAFAAPDSAFGALSAEDIFARNGR